MLYIDAIVLCHSGAIIRLAWTGLDWTGLELLICPQCHATHGKEPGRCMAPDLGDGPEVAAGTDVSNGSAMPGSP